MDPVYLFLIVPIVALLILMIKMSKHLMGTSQNPQTQQDKLISLNPVSYRTDLDIYSTAIQKLLTSSTHDELQNSKEYAQKTLDMIERRKADTLKSK